MAKVKILYASVGGNTEVVCQKVADTLKANGHQVDLQVVKLATPEDAKTHDALILACPTYGHGELENFFQRWVNASKDLDLSDFPCAVIGLGEAKYDPDYVMESAKILTKFIKTRGAKILNIPLMITGAPFPFLETRVPQWAEKVSNKLNG